MGARLSLAEQAKPLPPLVREVIPVQSSHELLFLLVSFLGLLLGGAGLVLARTMLPLRSRAPQVRKGDEGDSPDPGVPGKMRLLSESPPGYDVIHDHKYLHKIEEADDPRRLRRVR